MRKTYYLLLEEIKNFFKRAHKTKAVVHVSGGIDSALTLKLCCDALKNKNVTAILMPEKGLTSEKNIKDALDFIKKLKVKHYVVDINPFLESHSHIPWKQSKNALMNTKARIRSVLMYNYANSNNSLVAGATNKSEHMIGQGIKYGDLACDVYVLGDMLKTEVVELAKFLELPDTIIKKKPSLELTVGQTDESDLGATYNKIDSVLKKILIEEKLNKRDTIVKKTLQRIDRNKHKNLSVPIIEIK